MFYIVGGKTEFTQWEIDQKLMNEHMQSGDTVVFASASGKTHNMTAYDLAGQAVVDVPNDMLQAAQGIVVTLGQGAEHKGGCRTAFAVVAADMPDGYAYKDNSKAKPNATHYDTRDIRTVTYTFDGNLEGKEVIQGLVYLGDIPNCQNIADAVFTVTSNHPTFAPMSSRLTPYGDGWWTWDGNLYYVPADEEVDGDMFKAGLYAVAGFYEFGAGMSIACEYAVSGELKKLDAKYLPDNVCYIKPLDKYCDKIVEINAYYTDYGRKSRGYARLIELEEPFDGRELDLTKEEFDVLYNHLAKDTLEGNSLCLVSYGLLGSFYFEGDNRIVFHYSGIEGVGTLTYYDYKWFLEWNTETNGATLALTCNERLISSTAIEE